MQTVQVELGKRSYPIIVGPGARTALQERINKLSRVSKLVVVADQAVADLHLSRLENAMVEEPLVLRFRPGEASKTLHNVEQLCEGLAEGRIDRRSLIISFGGGVAGDLAGFVASVWLRGVRYMQIPTTLLAAVDASVGGKTGVNLRFGKNLVGAFHQPEAVIVDTEFLDTLSPRDYAAGLAESVKQAAIRDMEFLDWHEERAAELNARRGEVVTELIARNCALKAEIVALDEREANVRAILNYGHTIGHAIEHLLGYELRHGECVALGMLVENEIACARGWLDCGLADRIGALLAKLRLPVRLPQTLSAEDIWRACQQDKKVQDGQVHFVLLRGVAQPERVADVSVEEVAEALQVVEPDA